MSTSSTPPRRGASGIAKLMFRAMVAAYRWSGGAIGGKMGHTRVLLLTTTGRRTGRAHTIPIAYFDVDPGSDNRDIFIVGSNAGSDRNPAWYFNLTANPRVDVEIRRDRAAMIATVASAEERARLWQRLVAVAPEYQGYEHVHGREVPIVVLHKL